MYIILRMAVVTGGAILLGAGKLAVNLGVSSIVSEGLTNLVDEYTKDDPLPEGLTDEQKVAELERRLNDPSAEAKFKRFLKTDTGQAIVGMAPYMISYTKWAEGSAKKLSSKIPGVKKTLDNISKKISDKVSNIFNKPKVNSNPIKNTPGSDGGGLGYPKGAGMPPKTAGGATPKQGVGGGNTFSNVPKNQQGGKGAGSASGNKTTTNPKSKTTTPPSGGSKPTTISGGGAGTKPNPAGGGATPAPKKGGKLGKASKIAGGLATAGVLGKMGWDAMTGDEPPAEEEQKVDPAVVTSPDNVLTDRQKELVAQGQELAQAKTQNAIDKENGIVDFDDPRELEALASGLPDNVKSGTRVLPNRQKLQFQADAKGAMIRQQQQAKNDRRKQATIDHNATTMREDPRIAEIKQAFNDTSDLREDGTLWNGLDEAQKQQMVRNYYMNETNSSQKRQKLQDIAGKDALVGNIYKDGKLQAGDANYATDEYFANKKGFNKENFTKGTGLQHAGTGIVGTNLEDTVNEGNKTTLEMGSRFDDAGGEETAQPFLSDAQKAVLGHHNARPGTYTDKFGQQSAMNKDTRRITSDDQDYGDAVFNSPQDAVAYHNRSKEESPEQPPEEGTENPPVAPVPPTDGGQGVFNPNNLLPLAMRVMSRKKIKPKAKVRKAEAPTPKSKSSDAPVPKQATPVQQPAQPVKTPARPVYKAQDVVKKPAPQPTYKTMDGQTKSIPQAPKTPDMMSDKSLPKSPLDIPAKSTGLPGTTPRTPVSAPSPTPTKPRPGIFDQGVPKTNPKTNMNNGRVEVAPNNRPRKPNFEEPDEILKRNLSRQAVGVN